MNSENDIGTNSAALPNEAIGTEASTEGLPPGTPPAEATAPPSTLLDWIRTGLRATALRQIKNVPAGPNVSQMLVVWICSVGVGLILQRLMVNGPVSFSFSYWIYHWASTGIAISAVWLIVNWKSVTSTHASPVAAWFLLSAISTTPISILYVALAWCLAHFVEWSSRSILLTWGVYLLAYGWIVFAAWRIARAINRRKLVAVCIVLISAGVSVLDATILRFPVWQPDYTARENEEEEEDQLSLSQEVFETQQALLSTALGKIKRHEGKQRQLYALVYAPYSQDVFLHESSMVQDVLEASFGAKDHIVRLVNHPSVTDEIPWATSLNMKHSLSVIAKAMDKERDILVVYLTSHGGRDFVLAAQHYPLETEGLPASELRAMLDKERIQNRVIIVSACYSGGWIDQLRNDSTLVMTAADKDHTSYGCGSKSDLTYFGRALFDEQLRKTTSFVDAFNAAVPIIRDREIEGKKEDGFSNPQIAVGPDIAVVLDEWSKGQTQAK